MQSRSWKATAVVVAALAGACGGGSSVTEPTSLPTATPAPALPDARARYRVTLDATWDAATHPVQFPTDPHFSPLIGGTHSDQVVFWAPGAVASPGIEAMAEEGRVSPFDAEIEAALAAGTAEGLIRGGGIFPSPGAVSVEFQIGRDRPLVTLVAMIAPSPDWFIGVHGLSLIDNGDWVDEMTVPLPGYDAGTDSGTTYRARNSDTAPPEPIRQLEGPPVESGGMVAPFGTLTFVRLPS